MKDTVKAEKVHSICTYVLHISIKLRWDHDRVHELSAKRETLLGVAAPMSSQGIMTAISEIFYSLPSETSAVPPLRPSPKSSLNGGNGAVEGENCAREG